MFAVNPPPQTRPLNIYLNVFAQAARALELGLDANPSALEQPEEVENNPNSENAVLLRLKSNLIKKIIKMSKK